MTKLNSTPTISSTPDTIADALIEKTRYLFNIHQDIQLSAGCKSLLKDFLLKNCAGKRANVLIVKSIPTDTSFCATKTITSGDYVIDFAMAKNHVKDKHPYVLYCASKKSATAKDKAFCASRYIPDSLLNEVLPLLDLSKPVTIRVYEKAKEWNSARSSHAPSSGITFVGQKPNEKTGSFCPSQPIGYVLNGSNELVATNPAAKGKLTHGCAIYTFK